jgi:hypothetical protein
MDSERRPTHNRRSSGLLARLAFGNVGLSEFRPYSSRGLDDLCIMTDFIDTRIASPRAQHTMLHSFRKMTPW